MAEQPQMSPETRETADALDRGRRDQQQRIAAMTPAERFAMMDRLCRELTSIAPQARPVE